MNGPRRLPAHARPVWVERFTQESSARATPSSTHDHTALALVTEGHALVEQRGRFEVQSGDVLLVPAGQAHRFIRNSRTTAFGVGFCAPCYAPSELASLLDPFERARFGASPVVHLPGERHEHVARLMTELHAETQADRAHVTLVQKSLLALVLAEVAAPRVAHRPRTSNRASSPTPFASSSAGASSPSRYQTLHARSADRRPT